MPTEAPAVIAMRVKIFIVVARPGVDTHIAKESKVSGSEDLLPYPLTLPCSCSSLKVGGFGYLRSELVVI